MSPSTLPVPGRIARIGLVLLGWDALVPVSVVNTARHGFTRTPDSMITRWARVLTTLSMGSVAVPLTVLADKAPRPGEHERFIQRTRQQAPGSTLHRVAEDAMPAG